MQFPFGNSCGFAVEKVRYVHKSDIFAMSKWRVRRATTSGAQRDHIASLDPEENIANPLEIHAFPENVRGAADI